MAQRKTKSQLNSSRLIDETGDDVGVQTNNIGDDVNRIFLIDEEIQFGNDVLRRSRKERKLECFQFHKDDSKFNTDSEISHQPQSQTVSSELHKDDYDIEDEQIMAMNVKEEEATIISTEKDLIDREVLALKVATKHGKAIQVGYPRTNVELDIGCQSMIVLHDSAVQASVADRTLINDKITNNRHILIYKELQYGYGFVNNIGSKSQFKGKKLQVGPPRLTIDIDMSCQTGRLIADAECQIGVELETLNIKPSNVIPKPNKKVQSEYSCLYKRMDWACQMNIVIKETATQTESENKKILSIHSLNPINVLRNVELQYNDPIIINPILEKLFKIKKEKNSNLKSKKNFENFSCQINSSESSNIIRAKEFIDKEIQSGEVAISEDFNKHMERLSLNDILAKDSHNRNSIVSNIRP